MESLMHNLGDGLLSMEFAIRFLVAVLCGGAIGMERETTGKPAGLRTCILVCLGSMIFTEISIMLARTDGGDPTRIAAQIVTGVGFLGAGVILHAQHREVRGVTTAAMIWLMAALGMMIGAGYVTSAILVTASSVLMILALRRVEDVVHARRFRDYSFEVEDDHGTRERFAATLNLYDDAVRRLSVQPGRAGTVTVRFRFNGLAYDRRRLIRSLCLMKGVVPGDGAPEPAEA